jgi:hypothetical protein
MSDTGTVQTGTDVAVVAKTHTLSSDNDKDKLIRTLSIIFILAAIGVAFWFGYLMGSTACKRKNDSVRDPYDVHGYCDHWIQKSIQSDSDLSKCMNDRRQGSNYGNAQYSANRVYAMDGDYYDTGSNGPQFPPKKNSSEEEEEQILRTF